MFYLFQILLKIMRVFFFFCLFADKMFKKKLLTSFLALLLIIKLIKIKLMYVLPVIIGVNAAKKLLLKTLLFLFPPLVHLFKLCTYYHAHAAKLHFHHHKVINSSISSYDITISMNRISHTYPVCISHRLSTTTITSKFLCQYQCQYIRTNLIRIMAVRTGYTTNTTRSDRRLWSANTIRSAIIRTIAIRRTVHPNIIPVTI